MDLVTELTIMVLAIFVGFEVISKVPATLHTPLMSQTNAIHGIVVLGGLFLLYAVQLLRDYSDLLARATFKYSIVYLAALFTALLVDHYVDLRF